MGDNESLVASEASNDPPRSPSPIPPEPAAASTPDAFPSIASDTSSSAQRVVTGKRKRALFQTETVEMMRQIQAEDVAAISLNFSSVGQRICAGTNTAFAAAQKSCTQRHTVVILTPKRVEPCLLVSQIGQRTMHLVVMDKWALLKTMTQGRP
uniref:Uncharacterized protein n=2 Tax=Knipowitschia caucasica TaxID=637954 RepID=A0AAV2MQ44_KNICA